MLLDAVWSVVLQVLDAGNFNAVFSVLLRAAYEPVCMSLLG